MDPEGKQYQTRCIQKPADQVPRFKTQASSIRRSLTSIMCETSSSTRHCVGTSPSVHCLSSVRFGRQPPHPILTFILSPFSLPPSLHPPRDSPAITWSSPSSSSSPTSPPSLLSSPLVVDEPHTDRLSSSPCIHSFPAHLSLCLSCQPLAPSSLLSSPLPSFRSSSSLILVAPIVLLAASPVLAAILAAAARLAVLAAVLLVARRRRPIKAPSPQTFNNLSLPSPILSTAHSSLLPSSSSSAVLASLLAIVALPSPLLAVLAVLAVVARRCWSPSRSPLQALALKASVGNHQDLKPHQGFKFQDLKTLQAFKDASIRQVQVTRQVCILVLPFPSYPPFFPFLPTSLLLVVLVVLAALAALPLYSSTLSLSSSPLSSSSLAPRVVAARRSLSSSPLFLAVAGRQPIKFQDLSGIPLRPQDASSLQDSKALRPQAPHHPQVLKPRIKTTGHFGCARPRWDTCKTSSPQDASSPQAPGSRLPAILDVQDLGGIPARHQDLKTPQALKMPQAFKPRIKTTETRKTSRPGSE
ncbi:hypothetical protein DFH06DRAFT_1448322 [Mycena polygramma]|nr:hypothetical protein DFH06DRAFT_1448322 [Mycena polygramma]